MKSTPGADLAIRVALFYCTLARVYQSVQERTEVQLRSVRDTILVRAAVCNFYNQTE